MRVRHCGKIGDVIYCMAAMRRLWQFSGDRVDVLLHDFHLSAAGIECVTPLLESQDEYIRVVAHLSFGPSSVGYGTEDRADVELRRPVPPSRRLSQSHRHDPG